MNFVKEVRELIRKEMMLEWKQKYAFNGLLLYVLSIVFVISLAFVQELSVEAWNVIFWVIMLFVAINAVAKSFIGEHKGHIYYLHTLGSAQAIISAKMIYNGFILVIIGFVTFLMFLFFSPIKIEDPALFCLVLFLATLGFSANLTLVSAIASKAENKATLLTVLSLPLTVPLLLTAIRGSFNAIKGIDRTYSWDELIFFLSFIVIIAVLSVILFPYIWKD